MKQAILSVAILLSSSAFADVISLTAGSTIQITPERGTTTISCEGGGTQTGPQIINCYCELSNATANYNLKGVVLTNAGTTSDIKIGTYGYASECNTALSKNRFCAK